MATKEELASRLARELAETFATEVYGSEGPDLDCDIDEIEDVAVLANKSKNKSKGSGLIDSRFAQQRVLTL